MGNTFCLDLSFKYPYFKYISNANSCCTYTMHNMQYSLVYVAWTIYPISLQGFPHCKSFSHVFSFIFVVVVLQLTQILLYEDNFKLNFIPVLQWPSIIPAEFLNSVLLKIRSIHKIAMEGLLAQLQELYFKGPRLCAREKLSQAVLRTLKVDIRHALLEVLCCKQTFIYFLNRGWKGAIISIFGLQRFHLNASVLSTALQLELYIPSSNNTNMESQNYY